MAGLRCCAGPTTIPPLKKINGFRCFALSSPAPDNRNQKDTQTPKLVKIAVSGLTEFLRLLSSPNKTGRESGECGDDISVSSIDDVVKIIESDYENAYFVTGLFTSAIYAEDCSFEDPTIKFRGKELYARNLKLLVPFFDNPTIKLKSISKGFSSTTEFIVTSWKLRTYLKLPWRPLISIDGMTVYDLDDQLRIVRHVESWKVSALEAISQIFMLNSGRSGD